MVKKDTTGGRVESIEHYFVAISPTHKLDDALLRRAAALLSTDGYNMRLLLAGEMPRIVAQYQAREPAAALAKELSGLGLAASAGSNLDLRRESFSRFLARGFQAGEKDVVFRNANGETVRISADEACLIIEGILPADEQKKESKTEKTLNLPVTLLLGGIPVWRKSRVTAGPASESGNEHFLRFYRRTSPDPVVEIRSGGFDYSSLGEKKGYSSTENFKTVISELCSLFPHAVYDSSLTRNNRADTSSSSPQEALERNSRLIYLFYLSAQTAHPQD